MVLCFICGLTKDLLVLIVVYFAIQAVLNALSIMIHKGRIISYQ